MKQPHLFQDPGKVPALKPLASDVPPDGDLVDRIFDETPMDPVKKSRRKRKIWDALQGKPKTMMQLSVETHVMRSSICPIINAWRDQGFVFFTGRDVCPITKHKADFYTANKEIFLEITKSKGEAEQ